jgi:glycosyltransferase involved in cell wall biosynthesis
LTKVVVIAQDFSPPWNHGTKVYARGLLESLNKIDDLDIDVKTTVEPGNGDDHYDIAHIVYTGREIIREALTKLKYATVFKHIITPATGIDNALLTFVFYAAIGPLSSKLIKCFSSEFVARSFLMDAKHVIPPSIDTTRFRPSEKVSTEEIFSILEKSDTKTGLNNLATSSSQGLLLYSGPLTRDRFPFDSVLNAVSISQVHLLIVGRDYPPNSTDADTLDAMLYLSRKLGIEKKISIALKTLSEDEKVKLINYSDIVIYPFSNKVRNIVIDPPIFLLESMGCGKPVITSRKYSLQTLIQNGINGYTMDWHEDRDYINEAISNCIDHRSIGVNALRTVLENFSNDAVAEKLRKLYNENTQK